MLSWLATRNEAKAILYGRLTELERLPGKSLRAFVATPGRERVLGASGKEYTVTTVAFWDTSPEDSDLYVEVSVEPSSTVFARSCKSGLVVDPYTYEVERYWNFPPAK